MSTTYDANRDGQRLAATSALSGCRSGFVVTPSDTVDLLHYAKAIRVGADGDVCFIPVNDADGATLTVTLKAGDVFDMFQIRRVLATGTTATPIIAGWN